MLKEILFGKTVRIEKSNIQMLRNTLELVAHLHDINMGLKIQSMSSIGVCGQYSLWIKGISETGCYMKYIKSKFDTSDFLDVYETFLFS